MHATACSKFYFASLQHVCAIPGLSPRYKQGPFSACQLQMILRVIHIWCPALSIPLQSTKQGTEYSHEPPGQMTLQIGSLPDLWRAADLRKFPPCTDMAAARDEASMVMFGAVRDVLHKTGINAEDVGILVVNCSLFNPTPSLAAYATLLYSLFNPACCLYTGPCCLRM